MDWDVKNAIETLQEEGPTSLKNDLQDWKIEEIDGRRIIFYKGKNYVPKDQELRWDIVKMFMTTKQQDTLENLKLTIHYDNITGGQECAPSSKTTYRDVAYANSLKSTDLQLIWFIKQ